MSENDPMGNHLERWPFIFVAAIVIWCLLIPSVIFVVRNIAPFFIDLTRGIL